MSLQAIALVCHNLEINGANNFLLMLSSVIRKNFSVTLFSPKPGKMADRYISEGVEVIFIDGDFDFDSLYLYSAVFVNTLMMSRVILESQRRNIPHALVVHETWHPERLEYYLNELWNVEGVEKVDIISALQVSENVVFPAKYLADVYKSLVDIDRTSTIYCAIDMRKIDEYVDINTKIEMRRKLTVEQDAIIFLQMGTVTRRKAQMKSVESFDVMCARIYPAV
jgi:glycosyltransferase involved in cell wall biosynthesis